MLSACAKPKPPTLKPYAAQVVGIDPSGISLRLQLDATNPNRIALSVRSVSGTVTLNETVRLGRASVPTRVRLPARETTRVSAALKVAWQNLSEAVSLAASGKTVRYRLQGTARVGGEDLDFEVPFKIDGKLTAAELLGATVRSLPGLDGLSR
jgi:LEA14-like dessication related protein